MSEKSGKERKLEGGRFYAEAGKTLTKQAAELKKVAEQEAFTNHLLRLQVDMLEVRSNLSVRM
jgi:hypothetical protein